MVLQTVNLSFIEQKTVWGKEKMLVTSILILYPYYYQNAFSEGALKVALCCKGLNRGQMFAKYGPINVLTKMPFILVVPFALLSGVVELSPLSKSPSHVTWQSFCYPPKSARGLFIHYLVVCH